MSEIFIIKDTGKGVINELSPEKVVPIQTPQSGGTGSGISNYSLAEISTASIWEDSKPIYKKKFEFDTLLISGLNNILNEDLTNMENFIQSQIFVSYKAPNGTTFKNYFDLYSIENSAGDISSTTLFINDQNLVFDVNAYGSATGGTLKGHLILEYTKITE